VEWRKFDSFLMWVCFMEAADIRSETRHRSHIVDSATNILSLTQELGDYQKACKVYADTIAGSLGTRRVADATHVVRNVEAPVLAVIAKWRSGAEGSLANHFREGFLTLPIFASLKNQHITIDQEAGARSLTIFDVSDSI
jgi:hypothetical protein